MIVFICHDNTSNVYLILMRIFKWLVVTSFGTRIFGFVFIYNYVSAFIEFMVEKRVKIES